MSLFRENLENFGNLKCKLFFIIHITLLFIILFLQNIPKDISNTKENTKSKIIDDNFFIIDSNKLDNIVSHMYGFTISKKGILTNNYYKKIGEYENPEPQGMYIMIKKNGDEIILKQDFQGSFGLYIYENKKDCYFAISNSFYFLLEYLINNRVLSFNKDYADNFIITNLCSYSLNETMIKEIFQIPSNAFIIINIKKKQYKILYNDYKENSIPLESKEGLIVIDKWIDKWGYIFRSLKKITDNVSFDLSGGFDTRTLLTILLNSGVNMNEVFVRSFKDKLHNHDVDLKIANDISSKFGFKINSFRYDNKTTKWNIKETIFCTLYSKLGFHKEFYFQNAFYNQPRFTFKGSGGEALRGAPGIPIEKYKEKISFNDISGHEKDFYNSSIKLINRSIYLLKKAKKFNNDYEISNRLYTKVLDRNHFGKSALEGFMANIYCIQPLSDPDIRKIKYNDNEKLSHDLIAYIYVRFSNSLIDFQFEGNRILNKNSIKKAKKLNNNYIPYQIKRDYNKHFYIDMDRKFSASLTVQRKNVYEIFKGLFNSSIFFSLINKIYDKNVYNWAKLYYRKSKFVRLRHGYGLLAIAMTFEKIKLNEKYMKNSNYKIQDTEILNYLIQLN